VAIRPWRSPAAGQQQGVGTDSGVRPGLVPRRSAVGPEAGLIQAQLFCQGEPPEIPERDLALKAELTEAVTMPAPPTPAKVLSQLKAAPLNASQRARFTQVLRQMTADLYGMLSEAQVQGLLHVAGVREMPAQPIPWRQVARQVSDLLFPPSKWTE